MRGCWLMSEPLGRSRVAVVSVGGVTGDLSAGNVL